MIDLEKSAETLRHNLEDALSRLKISDLKKELDKLKAKSEASDFWANRTKAEEVMRGIASLEARIVPWQELDAELRDVIGLSKLGDSSLSDDLEKQLANLSQKFNELKIQLRFSGPYDDHDVILSIYAGAGGTDAQDWAQMLLRMYTRWAESKKLKAESFDQNAGEEAGIKSATIKLSNGDFLYGKLAGEHGVHRLVRLSPFNADHLRQTSFAKVEVMPAIDKPSEMQLDEKDLKIDVFRAGGHGGQSVNTTDSAVRVTHIPTGITTSIQNERSQLQNKETALGILRSKLVAMQLEQHAENLADIKGPNQSAEWGSQIRSYVLHPYKQVKDLRTGYETTDPQSVLDGDLDPLIDAWLEHKPSV